MRLSEINLVLKAFGFNTFETIGSTIIMTKPDIKITLKDLNTILISDGYTTPKEVHDTQALMACIILNHFYRIENKKFEKMLQIFK